MHRYRSPADADVVKRPRIQTKGDDVKHIFLVIHEIWARVMPVAVTYASSGLAAAVVTACSLALAGRR